MRAEPGDSIHGDACSANVHNAKARNPNEVGDPVIRNAGSTKVENRQPLQPAEWF